MTRTNCTEKNRFNENLIDMSFIFLTLSVNMHEAGMAKS